MPLNPIRMHINLSNTRRKIKNWEQRLDGTHPEDNIKIFLQEFMTDVREAIVIQYIHTYSKNPKMIARRTYRLEKALNFDNVRQTSRFGWTGTATRQSMWPLGAGEPWYAIVQEDWITKSGPRAFLLEGDSYIKIFLEKRLNARLRKWSRS